eukprot:GDKI01049253.1.p1 GENE.GDKI01049253.1~~GDKI01049253.1.p1  ORF type:complete len:324 (-),score=44.85 GDKI01049253.1:21-992(-)
MASVTVDRRAFWASLPKLSPEQQQRALVVKRLGVSRSSTRDQIGEKLADMLSFLRVSPDFMASKGTIISCIVDTCGGMVLLVPGSMKTRDSILKERCKLRAYRTPVYIEPLRSPAAQQAHHLQRRIGKLESEKAALNERVNRLENLLQKQTHTAENTHTSPSPLSTLTKQQSSGRSVSFSTTPTAASTPRQAVHTPATGGCGTGEQQQEKQTHPQQSAKRKGKQKGCGGKGGVCTLRVTSVHTKGPAGRAGLQVGDEVVSFGSLQAASVADDKEFLTLKEVVRKSIYNEVPVVVRRGGEHVTLTVRPKIWEGDGLLGCHMEWT